MDAALKAALGSDAAAVTKAVSQAVAAGRYDIVTVSGWVVQVQPFPVKHGDRAFDVTVSAPSWS